MNEVYATKVGDAPAGTLDRRDLALPSGALVEIEAIAAR